MLYFKKVNKTDSTHLFLVKEMAMQSGGYKGLCKEGTISFLL